jgi:hypothetical protein
VASGIWLLKRPYWNDQAYVDEQSLRLAKMSFDEIVASYGWEKIDQEHLISKTALKKKFIEQIGAMDYSSIVKKYGKEIRAHGFISWKELQQKLHDESRGISARAFKEKYGDQPLADGVVDANDTLYSEMVKSAITTMPYEQIAREFAFETTLPTC